METTNNRSLDELKTMRIIDMTGAEFLALAGGTKDAANVPPLVYGIDGLARLLGVSIPTAQRIKTRGLIDAAVTQIGRIIIIRADIALDLLHDYYEKKPRKKKK